MPLRLVLLLVLLATAGCQPHWVPGEPASPSRHDENTEVEGAATGDEDAMEEVVVVDSGEEADALPDGRRSETPDRLERLVSRTRMLGGARSALRERRRR